MKMRWQKITSLLLLFLFTVGCGAINQIKNAINKSQQPVTLLSKDGKCQLTVPSGWRGDSDLHEDAIIQASERGSELYVVVLPSNKADFTTNMTLDSLTKLLRADLSKNVAQAESTNPIPTIVNDLPSQQFEMSGAVSGVKVKYIYTVVETSDSFYQILTWTLASRYESNKQILLDVTNSFKETNAKPPSVAPPIIKSSPTKSKF